MNAKYVIALILALQVSTSLCDVPTPSTELLDKYNEMKKTFLMRLTNAYNKAKTAADARMDSTTGGTAVKSKIDELLNGDEFKATHKSFDNLIAEVEPYMEKGRTAVLGAYEEHLRPVIGQYLSDFIDVAKVYLDKAMPAQ